MEIPSTTTIQPGAAAPRTTSRNELSRDDFYKLMIAEMTNQDPFEPADNQKYLEQISAMQALDSTDRLTESIEKLVLRQELSSAAELIGRYVSANDLNGGQLTGRVERLTVRGDKVGVILDSGREISFDQVVEVALEPIEPTVSDENGSSSGR